MKRPEDEMKAIAGSICADADSAEMRLQDALRQKPRLIRDMVEHRLLEGDDAEKILEALKAADAAPANRRGPRH